MALTQTGFETLFINAFGSTPETAGYTVLESAPGVFGAQKGDQLVELEIYNNRIMGWNVNGERRAEFQIHARDETRAGDRLAALTADRTGPKL